MNNKAVMEEIGVAKNGVASAENDLATLLKKLQAAPRAEKTTISKVLHSALKKLRDAREHLGKLETPNRSKDD
jgi:hypothetical protein